MPNALTPWLVAALLIAAAEAQTHTDWRDYSGAPDSAHSGAAGARVRWTLATQPFPAKPPPFARQKFTVDEFRDQILLDGPQ